MKIDTSLSVLWTIANAEAKMAAEETIAPAFLWLAALKLLDKHLPVVIKELGIESEGTAQLSRAINSIKMYLEISEQQATFLRRSLRKRLCADISQPSKNKKVGMLHCTNEAREIFWIAEKIAKKNGALSVSAYHIVHAMFDAEYVSSEDLKVD